MSLFSNLRTSSSGLLVASTSMSVIGDNIANVNTIGFKRGHASFADSFPVDVSYVHGPISIGTGAYIGKTSDERRSIAKSTGKRFLEGEIYQKKKPTC